MKRLKAILLGVMLFLLAIAFDLHTRRQEMSTGVKKAWTYVLIGALGILVLRLLTGCVHPQPQRLYIVPVLVLDTLNPNDAITTCSENDLPIISVKAWVLADSVEYHYTRIHEDTHVSQVINYGSCREFMRRVIDDKWFRFRIEAEAYCASYSARQRDGAKQDWTLLELSDFLARMIGTSRLVAAENLPCREGG